jgi:hypothetical protein
MTTAAPKPNPAVNWTTSALRVPAASYIERYVMSYFISPSSETLTNALDSWQWIELAERIPILVTAFADVFFSAHDGIWFLDTLEGKLKYVFPSHAALEAELSTEGGQDLYLFSAFVDRAIRDGNSLEENQCYDFRIHPIVGGAIEYDNVERLDFSVALDIRGQLHDQVRHLPAGTKISKVIMDEERIQKPWWKLW